MKVSRNYLNKPHRIYGGGGEYPKGGSIFLGHSPLWVGTARLCYQISKKLLKICQKVAPKFRKVAQKVAQSEKSCSKVALMFLYLQYTFDIISNSISNSNIKEHMYCSSFYIITRKCK